VRLTINGESVSYSLEEEKTLGQVVSGIRSWLAAEGFIITSLTADADDLLNRGAPPWSDREIAAVEELAVEASRTADMRLAHWQSVDSWLGLLVRELSAGTGAESGVAARMPPGVAALHELTTDMPQTIDGFKLNPFLPAGSDAMRRFGALFAAAEPKQIAVWPPERRTEAAAVVNEMLEAVRARIADATNPREALSRCAARLKAAVTTLPDVSVLLQTNRDKEAMGLVITFTDTVQSLMGLLPFLPPDPQRARALSDLTPILKELVAAFDTRDSILIGDLLEYEIAPRMAHITPLLENAS